MCFLKQRSVIDVMENPLDTESFVDQVDSCCHGHVLLIEQHSCTKDVTLELMKMMILHLTATMDHAKQVPLTFFRLSVGKNVALKIAKIHLNRLLATLVW